MQYFKRFQLTFCTDAECQSVVSTIQLVCPVYSNQTARKNVVSVVTPNVTQGPAQKRRKLDETNASTNAHAAPVVPALSSPMVIGQATTASTSRLTQPVPLGWKDALLSTQGMAGIDNGLYAPSQPPAWWPGTLPNHPGNPMLVTPTPLAQPIPPIPQPRLSQSQRPPQMQSFASSQPPPTTQPYASGGQTQQTPSSHPNTVPIPSLDPITGLMPHSSTLLTQVDALLRANVPPSSSAPLQTPHVEGANLSALSPHELEKAVIQVINEPGFVELVRPFNSRAHSRPLTMSRWKS